jgi:hypothetical protein
VSRYGRRVQFSYLAAIVLTAALMGLARDCAAETASVSASAGTEMLLRSEAPKKFYSFARVQTNIPVITCIQCKPSFHLFARVDKSVLTDERPDILQAGRVQFDTLEVYGGAYRKLLGQVHAAGMYGYLVPLQPSKASETYPETYGGGVFVGDPASGRWLLLAAGRHDSAGPGAKFMFAGQVPIDGRLTLVADGVMPKGFVRAGVALAVAR